MAGGDDENRSSDAAKSPPNAAASEDVVKSPPNAEGPDEVVTSPPSGAAQGEGAKTTTSTTTAALGERASPALPSENPSKRDLHEEIPDHLPSFPKEPERRRSSANLILGIALLGGTAVLLVMLRISARNLMSEIDRGGPVDKLGVATEVPIAPEPPKRREAPPIDSALRGEMLGTAQKACTTGAAAPCIEAVDKLEGQGEPIDPELLAYRVTSLAAIGDRARTLRLGRYFLLRFPDHASRDRVKKVVDAALAAANEGPKRPPARIH